MSSSKFDPTLSTTSAKRLEQTEQIERLHGKTFGSWAGHQLKKKGYPSISDVTVDFRTGVHLIHLVEALFDIHLEKKFHENPTSEIHKNENVTLALEVLKQKNVNLTVSSKDIVDGNRKLTLGLMWILVMRHQILKPEDDDKPASQKNKQAKGNLMTFCQRQLQGYEGVNIQDMQESFYDGLAFCGLIHKLKPDLLDFNQMRKASVQERLTKAFEIGEKLGIPRLLDVNDMCHPDPELKPDEKCIMTYVSEFPIAFFEHHHHDLKGGEVSSHSQQQQSGSSNEGELVKKQQQEESARRDAELQEKNRVLLEEKEKLQKQVEEKGQMERISSQTLEENKKLMEELEKLKRENQKLQEDLSKTKNKLIGTLKVDVIEARDLPVMDFGGKADPYCRLKVADQEYKTHKKKRTLNPRWDQQFEFFVTDKRQILEIAVWDWDLLKSDDFVGKVVIKISELPDDQQKIDKWYKLLPLKQGEGDGNLGEIHLAISFKLGK